VKTAVINKNGANIFRMKKLKFFAMLLLAMTLTIGFTSCNDDDVASEIVGTWLEEDCSSENITVTMTFKKNGTFVETEDSKKYGIDVYTGKYTYKDNILTMIYDDDDPFSYTVVSVSESTLVLQFGSETYVWTRVK
ncbi:MAG: lipocalin family protein, partial [Candidatus Limisoma sp.]